MSEDRFSDEMISAYLDNELSQGDRTRVEEVLMDSAESRRMFDELKALRQTLQLLPWHELADDFPQRVLTRAESQVADADETANEIEEHVSDAGTMPTPSLDRIRLRSAIAWVAAVAAVVLVAVVVTPDANEDDPAARRSPVAAIPEEDGAARDHDEDSYQPSPAIPDTPQPASSNSVVGKSTGNAPITETRDLGFSDEGLSESKGHIGRMAGLEDEIETSDFPTAAKPQPNSPRPQAFKNEVEEGGPPPPADVRGGFGLLSESDAALAPSDPVLVYVEATSKTLGEASVESTLQSEGFADRDAAGIRDELTRRSLNAAAVSRVFAERRAADESQTGGQRKPQNGAAHVRMLVVTSTASEIESTVHSLEKQGFEVRVHREAMIASEELARQASVRQNSTASRQAGTQLADLMPQPDSASEMNRLRQQNSFSQSQAGAAADLEGPDSRVPRQPRGDLRGRTVDKSPAHADGVTGGEDGKELELLQKTDRDAEGAAGKPAVQASPQQSKSFYRVPADLSGQVTDLVTLDKANAAAVERDAASDKKRANQLALDRLVETSVDQQIEVIFIVRDPPQVEFDASAIEEGK